MVGMYQLPFPHPAETDLIRSEKIINGSPIVSAATRIGLLDGGVVAGTVTLVWFKVLVRLSLNRIHVFASRVVRIICLHPLSSLRMTNGLPWRVKLSKTWRKETARIPTIL